MSDPKVEVYFDKQSGSVASIASALRDCIASHGEGLTCALAWGFPCWSGNERIFSVIAHKDRCNLQLFSGNRLAAAWPARIEGTGKQLRHVKVRSVGEIDSELADIIVAAIKLDRIDPQKVK